MRFCPLLLVTLAVTFSVYASKAQEPELVDGIAAVVNGDVITFSQVRDVAAARERMLRASLRGAELVEQVQSARQSALNDLIDRQLILQDFKEAGLSFPQRVIDQRVTTVINEEFGGDRQAFLRTLQAQGYSLAKFKELERDKLIVQAMRQRNVRANVLISPQRVEEHYRTNRERWTTNDEVDLRMIVISKYTGDDGSTPETQKALAQEIRSKLAAGADFGRMAQMYSDDITRDEGGDWGWVQRNTLNEDLTREVFKLKAGEMSDVVDLGGSYYILRAQARKPGTVKPLEEVRLEIENELSQEERLKLQNEWLETLRKKAYIKRY